MDQTQPLPENPPSTVDTTSPFRSVKEAVALFGERFLATEIYPPSPKPLFTIPKHETPIWKPTSGSNQNLWKSPESEGVIRSPVLMDTLKKLESELQETKRELNMLKERESETEVALASLNAEVHHNMSKIAKAEAEVAGKAAAVLRSSVTLGQVLSGTEKEKDKYVTKKKKATKKKPVIPLVTDIFTRKNGKAGIHY